MRNNGFKPPPLEIARRFFFCGSDAVRRGTGGTLAGKKRAHYNTSGNIIMTASS